MMVFTITVKKKDSNPNKTVYVPAVLFSNQSTSFKLLEQTNPGIKINACYNCDANPNEVPLDVVLFDSNEELQIIQINHQLEEENMLLKKQLKELEKEAVTELINEKMKTAEVIPTLEDIKRLNLQKQKELEEKFKEAEEAEKIKATTDKPLNEIEAPTPLELSEKPV